ncbi:MAG TPA: DUF1330 domain-containing protein [Deltaproteobacteria bacterium]|mgnify:CR=1 FL=1|nr:DUF1330 domain-containing protein [Deltaproteobacteria bacterium]HPR55082.1 DUF1330 domain-containing protein [Deltaproteobacteria bacterium]
MAAYVIVQVEVTDPDRFGNYLKETPRVMERFGGRYLARGGETVTLEGDGRPGRVVIIEFPSLKDAEAWYGSEDYRRIKGLREGAATGTIVAVEGC